MRNFAVQTVNLVGVGIGVALTGSALLGSFFGLVLATALGVLFILMEG